MIWLFLSAQLVISNAPCVHTDRCAYHPQYWQALSPDSNGTFMVMENGHWHWHSLKELFERD